jgi:hypothetical protein
MKWEREGIREVTARREGRELDGGLHAEIRVSPIVRIVRIEQ